MNRVVSRRGSDSNQKADALDKMERGEYKPISRKKSLEEQGAALLKDRLSDSNRSKVGQSPLETRAKSLFLFLHRRERFSLKKCLARTLCSTAKKPVVLASNRDSSSPKTLRLAEWCPRQDLNLYDFTH
jgi:hypothetical protein